MKKNEEPIDTAEHHSDGFEDDDDEWESDGDGEVMSDQEIKATLKLGEQTNKLLKAIMSHPQMDRTDPSKSPKPLFFAADFVRRTYFDHLLPLLPREAVFRSSRFANEDMFGYPEDHPAPTEPADEYLNDPANWSHDSSNRQMYMDAFGRTMMICLAITDDAKGPMMLQGRFDWANPVDIKSLAQEMMDN